jgi:DNA-binding transcriptional regulator YiaG
MPSGCQSNRVLEPKIYRRNREHSTMTACITRGDIRAWRKRHALDQKTAARRLGLAQETFRRWERGRMTPGVTRGVSEEQFRRIVHTVRHT